MKKLFLLFALVLTVGMNAWAGDYVATDYLNDPYFTKIKQSPTLSDPSMVIYMFLRDPDNGEQCVTWGGYENQNEDILPKIYIDGELFAQPGWEMCWLNNNPDNGVDTWWDEKNKSCHVYTKEINGVTWTLRFYDVQHDHDKYCVSMYFCPSEIEGGSRHTITVKGRLTEYVGENTPSTTNYLDVERDFVFDMPKLITSNPKVVKENTNEHALSFYGNLAEGAEKSTYFGVYAPSSTDNRFIPYDNLDGKQELAYATTFSNIKYTIPEEFKGKDLRVQMHRDFSGALGGKVSVCHYYGRFNAAANAIHYEVTEPTYTTVGSLQECWKDLSTGIIYSDIFFENELNPAQVLTYAKFISNPVTANVGFTLKDATYEGYEGVKFNWAAETTYDWDRDTRYVEFTVYGTDVANARLKWTKNYNAAGYGRFAITVYVNGEQKYSVNQNNGESLGGLFAVPLPDLKSGDNVKFEVKNTKLPDYHGTPTIAACLEYTSSNGGSKVLHHEAAEPTYETVGNIEYWEDKTTGQFYSDVTCTQELSPAQVFTYKKLISDPVTANNGFTLKDETYEGVQFNWAAETTYPYNTTGTRYVEFTVYGTDVANARVKWTKNYKEASYGNFTITVYVNGVSVYSVNQNKGESLGGLSAIPLPDLKSGDKVKFEVNKPYVPEWYFADKPAIAACLEYTSSNGGRNPEITITADDKYKYIEQSDPELTWKITKGELMEGDKLTDIKIWRETGENGGLYPIHVSQEEGSNPKYNITFVDGVFRIIDAIHHEAAEPTYTTVGYSQEYWEDRTTGKYYSDAACTKELSPAQVFTYAKFKSNPVTAQDSAFTLKDATYEGVQFNWAAEITYYDVLDTVSRSVEFMVFGTDVANARVKWRKDYSTANYGRFAITVYVNDTQVYSVNQNNGESLGGLFAVPLLDLKSGDKVKFEVRKTIASGLSRCPPTITACLEYTSSNGGEREVILHDAVQPTYETVGNIEYWEDKETGKNYSDAACAKELSPAQVITYTKLISNPVTANNGFTLKDATYEGVQFNWAAERTYTKGETEGIRSVEFTVYGTDVDNARLIWTKDDTQNGQDIDIITITVYVNGTPVYSVKQRSFPLVGIFAIPLPDLKYGDVVKFEVQNKFALDDSTTIAACLEYTSSNGGASVILTADDKLKNKGDDDPELTWQITGGSLAEGDELTGIKIWREEGEEIGSYTIHVSQEEGSNPKYYITFVEGTFRISDIIHHDVTEPTYETVGYLQECWEDRTLGKYYSDVACTQELNPALVLSYAKFITNPVTANSDFTLKDAAYGGVQFNWAAETTYPYNTTGTRYVEFTVYGTDVANARVKWTKNYNAAGYGSFIITVYVNGTQVYSINQGNNALGGLSAIPLPDLKSGDKVKFEVNKPNKASWGDANPTITACLEYTSSNGGAGVILTADDKLKNKGDDDPELTWQITGGPLAEGDELTGIKIWREKGEEIGSYTIHVSQEEGSNPKYYIAFVEGTFRISDIIHHDVTVPMYETVGYLQECWEDRTLGKYYSDAEYTQELNPALVLSYAKFISNPVTANSGFTLKDAKYEGAQFNWAAETTYKTTSPEEYSETGTRSVEFTVFGTDVANARVKWTKNYNAAGYGSFIITVYVNGTQVYFINQGDNALGGLSAIPLPDLKSGDKVKFEVQKPKNSKWTGNVTIAACLEYTSSNGGEGMLITANQDPDHTENYYSTFWSSTDAYQVPEGVTAYTGKVEDSTSEPNTSVLKLTAIEDGIIPASQGVILRMTTEGNSATNQQIALAKTTATGTWSGTNALTGTDEATTLGANQYALSYGQNGVGFYLWNGKSIDAHKAYLTLTSGAKAFTFEFNDEPSGIKETFEPYNGTTETYNLNGMRVGKDYKGIVVVRGKKYLKK